MKISLLCQILSSLHLWHNWLRPSLQFIMRTKKDIFWPPLRPLADLQDGRGWGDLLPQLKDAAVAVKKVIIYLNWVFNAYTPKADHKNFRWYLKDSHRFSGSMAPLTPDLFLSCCISREKVFRGNGVTFREAGGRVRLCKLPSDAIATLQPHLSRKYAWEKKICPRKKCPRRKKVPEMSEKKQPSDAVAPTTTPQPLIWKENWYSSSKRRDFTTFTSIYKVLQKKRVEDSTNTSHLLYLTLICDYEQTLFMTSQYFHFNMPLFWEELLCWK